MFKLRTLMMKMSTTYLMQFTAAVIEVWVGIAPDSNFLETYVSHRCRSSPSGSTIAEIGFGRKDRVSHTSEQYGDLDDNSNDSSDTWVIDYPLSLAKRTSPPRAHAIPDPYRLFDYIPTSSPIHSLEPFIPDQPGHGSPSTTTTSTTPDQFVPSGTPRAPVHLRACRGERRQRGYMRPRARGARLHSRALPEVNRTNCIRRC